VTVGGVGGEDVRDLSQYQPQLQKLRDAYDEGVSEGDKKTLEGCRWQLMAAIATMQSGFVPPAPKRQTSRWSR